ncbi:hypothetical protein AMTR_s00152p00075530, partial [Amborella trichopoda]
GTKGKRPLTVSKCDEVGLVAELRHSTVEVHFVRAESWPLPKPRKTHAHA